MAKTSTYLNFQRNTEEAFNFYKSVFGGDFVDGKINRFGEIPAQEGMQYPLDGKLFGKIIISEDFFSF
jgi:uncharacterized glyoxalase superfamily protein PhnB